LCNPGIGIVALIVIAMIAADTIEVIAAPVSSAGVTAVTATVSGTRLLHSVQEQSLAARLPISRAAHKPGQANMFSGVRIVIDPTALQTIPTCRVLA